MGLSYEDVTDKHVCDDPANCVHIIDRQPDRFEEDLKRNIEKAEKQLEIYRENKKHKQAIREALGADTYAVGTVIFVKYAEEARAQVRTYRKMTSGGWRHNGTTYTWPQVVTSIAGITELKELKISKKWKYLVGGPE